MFPLHLSKLGQVPYCLLLHAHKGFLKKKRENFLSNLLIFSHHFNVIDKF